MADSEVMNISETTTTDYLYFTAILSLRIFNLVKLWN